MNAASKSVLDGWWNNNAFKVYITRNARPACYQVCCQPRAGDSPGGGIHS